MTPLAPLHTRGLLFYWRCSTVVRAGRRGSGPRLGDTASVCECVSESGGSPASPRAQPTSPRCPHVRFTPSPPAPRPTTPGVSVRTPSSSSTSSASGAPPPEPRGGQARVLPLCCWLFGWGEKPAQRRCRSAGCLSLPMCDLTVLTSSLLIVIVQEPSDAQTTDSQCASPPPSRPPRPPPPLSASPEEAALRVSFCPTLPPLVSKGQRLESRRERDWVQSVFLSVRPSLRKKAHSGLLLARSQSARRQGNKKELHFVWSSAVQRYCAQRNCARCVLTCPRDWAYFVRDLAQDWPEAGISECGQAVPAVRSVLRTVLKAVLQLVSKQNPKRQKRKKKKTVLQKVASAFSFEFSEPEAHLGASPDFPELCGKGCAQAVLRVGAQSALEPVLGMIPESSCPEGFQKSLPNS
nr:PREDICTED: DNA-binding death effector domain-containing protein 2 isoform X1 [Lepisosteus oculatus]